MTKFGSRLALARSAALPALCVAVIGYFAYHALIGPTGLLAWGGYARERVQLEEKAAQLSAERARLEQRNQLLDPRKVDPDMADELVRRNLGLVRPDEIVIPLPK